MTFTQWPLGDLAVHLKRPELEALRAAGYDWQDAYDIVDLFERRVADFAGAKHGIAVDCCSHGIFLALKYVKATGVITVPSRTYLSVPMQILHAGCRVKFADITWSGKYQLDPYPIWDAAVRWHQGMYQGGYHVISFQIKKRIPIGRGGMILTDDDQAADWFRRARHDGRDMHTPYVHDEYQLAGWHYYMTPEDAARGILLMDAIPGSYADSATDQCYVDLSCKKIFQT